MRQFIRHPINIPIEATPADSQPLLSTYDTHSVGIGGLAFHASHELKPGTVVQVKILHELLEFTTEARVVWCRSLDAKVDMGVEFLDSEDAFRARMIEQICSIENYRQKALQERGRELTTQEAAEEWVARFAESFPGSDTQPMH